MNYNPEVLMRILANKYEIPVETSMLLVAAIEEAIRLRDDGWSTLSTIKLTFKNIYNE